MVEGGIDDGRLSLATRETDDEMLLFASFGNEKTRLRGKYGRTDRNEAEDGTSGDEEEKRKVRSRLGRKWAARRTCEASCIRVSELPQCTTFFRAAPAKLPGEGYNRAEIIKR